MNPKLSRKYYKRKKKQNVLRFFILKICLKWSSVAILEVLESSISQTLSDMETRVQDATLISQIQHFTTELERKSDLREIYTGLLKTNAKFSKEIEKDYKSTSRSVISTIVLEKNTSLHPS